MHPLIEEIRSWTPEERKHVFITAISPYQTNSQNARLWAKIGLLTGCGIVISEQIIAAVHRGAPIQEQTFMTVVITLACIFDVFYWSLFVPLADALRERLAEERALKDQMIQEMIESQKRIMLDKIREAAGRAELHMDPISIVAATIEANAPKDELEDPAVNPLRGALDGTLRPQHLLRPEDDENFDSNY
jgi:hypothetical protein